LRSSGIKNSGGFCHPFYFINFERRKNNDYGPNASCPAALSGADLIPGIFAGFQFLHLRAQGAKVRLPHLEL
jgi:hypothetical protein